MSFFLFKLKMGLKSESALPGFKRPKDFFTRSFALPATTTHTMQSRQSCPSFSGQMFLQSGGVSHTKYSPATMKRNQSAL